MIRSVEREVGSGAAQRRKTFAAAPALHTPRHGIAAGEMGQLALQTELLAIQLCWTAAVVVRSACAGLPRGAAGGVCRVV